MILERCRARPVLVAVTVVALLAALSSTAGAATLAQRDARLPKGPKIDPNHPCTILGRKQVSKVFAAEIRKSRSNAGTPISTDCAWVVRDHDVLVGRLVGVVVYPAFVDPGTNAVDVMESDRANAQISGPGVADLPLGKGGFVLRPRSLVEVAPSKKFAFTLQWLPTGGAPEGGPITDEVRKQLTVLASDIAKRGKRV